MFKNSLITILVLLFIVSLAACGSSEDSSQSTAESQEAAENESVTAELAASDEVQPAVSEELQKESVKPGFPCNDVVTEAEFKANPQAASWEWFACLNEPVSSSQRQWELFKPIEKVFLPDGGRPQPYDYVDPIPTEVTAQYEQHNDIEISNAVHDLALDVQVDGLALEMGGQSPQTPTGTLVRYQLLMNRGTFDYIVERGVYNVNGQAALQSDLNFPKNSWELKTSWLWIGTNQTFLAQLRADGYYIINAWYRDEGGNTHVGYAAMSGMHVINKLFSKDWLWMTFENKNNPKYTITNGFPAQPMTNQTGPTDAAKAQNAIFQQKYPALGQYELIGVQDGFVERGTELLASSQMESAFQLRSSCVACHFTAAYSADAGYFNFAIPEQGGIMYPIEQLPESSFDGYNKLDFVWSLKRARWDRTAGGGQ